jgi:hypothetical protein
MDSLRRCNAVWQRQYIKEDPILRPLQAQKEEEEVNQKDLPLRCLTMQEVGIGVFVGIPDAVFEVIVSGWIA